MQYRSRTGPVHGASLGPPNYGMLLPWRFRLTLDGDIDWSRAKSDLAADRFDNGRSPDALCRSFQRSPHVVFARNGAHVVGMARLLSDGVCNAYLLDVWTASAYRRQGIGTRMVRFLDHTGSRSAHRPADRRSPALLHPARIQ